MFELQQENRQKQLAIAQRKLQEEYSKKLLYEDQEIDKFIEKLLQLYQTKNDNGTLSDDDKETISQIVPILEENIEQPTNTSDTSDSDTGIRKTSIDDSQAGRAKTQSAVDSDIQLAQKIVNKGKRKFPSKNPADPLSGLRKHKPITPVYRPKNLGHLYPNHLMLAQQPSSEPSSKPSSEQWSQGIRQPLGVMTPKQFRNIQLLISTLKRTPK